eukprot:scaffold1190_cov187-Ochromonas_danica.AAC.29
MKSSLEKQDNTEEENSKTEEVIRILKKRRHAEVVEEEVYAIPYKEEEIRRFDLERKLEECHINEKLVSELEESIKSREKEKARRVEVERKLKESQAMNDKLFTLLEDGQIAILLRNCSTNWQQMIESGDLTVLKTLETYNAIYRIPASLIHHHFTMTLRGYEIQAGEMSVYSSNMLLCILIGVGMTALHLAAVKGNEELARLLLLHPAIDVNAVDSENGWTPLYVACKYDYIDVVKLLLLDERVDYNKTYDGGATLLHIPCGLGHVDLLMFLLLDGRVDVNKTDDNGWTPFYCACWNDLVEIVKILLLDDRVDVNNIDDDAWGTPMYIACKFGHVEIVKVLLLDGRVDLNKTDSFGRTALDVAKKEDIKAMLRAKGAI